jgi:hypothetical protein
VGRPTNQPTAVARYAWALLLARIYDVFPLRCPKCVGAMRIIAFITDASTVREILAHLGEPAALPRIAPVRAPPLWAMAATEQDPTLAPPDPARPGLRVRPAHRLVAIKTVERAVHARRWACSRMRPRCATRVHSRADSPATGENVPQGDAPQPNLPVGLVASTRDTPPRCALRGVGFPIPRPRSRLNFSRASCNRTLKPVCSFALKEHDTREEIHTD